jgi:hypothetical protein
MIAAPPSLLGGRMEGENESYQQLGGEAAWAKQISKNEKLSFIIFFILLASEGRAEEGLE